MKVYISGPMTGRDGHNEAAFRELAAALRLAGYQVVSPVEETLRRFGSWEAAEAVPHSDHLAHDLGLIASDAVEAVAVMDDWLESKGSRREVSWALDYDKPIYDRRMRRVDVVESLSVRAGGVVTAASGAMKADGGKPRLDLVPFLPTLEAAKVLTFGAEKYDDHNWRKGFPFSRIKSSLDRHLGYWWSGEDMDPETGYSHLAHARCNVDFLLEFVLTGTGTDDRYKR